MEWPQYVESPSGAESGAGAEAAIPTKSIPVTLEQLERVISFNKMETESLKNTKVQARQCQTPLLKPTTENLIIIYCLLIS